MKMNLLIASIFVIAVVSSAQAKLKCKLNIFSELFLFFIHFAFISETLQDNSIKVYNNATQLLKYSDKSVV